MRYLTEPKYKNMLKNLTFCHLPENLVINMGKKNNGKSAAKTATKRVVQKTAEETGDLIGNKIADKITSAGKPEEADKTKKVEEIYNPPEKRQQMIHELKLF